MNKLIHTLHRVINKYVETVKLQILCILPKNLHQNPSEIGRKCSCSMQREAMMLP